MKHDDLETSRVQNLKSRGTSDRSSRATGMRNHLKAFGLSLAAALVTSVPGQSMAFDPNKALENYQPQKQQLSKEQLADRGVVTIKNMQWMRCSLGQVWDGQGCKGEATKHIWAHAIALPRILNNQGGFAGFTDWRLPSPHDLYALVRCKPGWVPDVEIRPNLSIECDSEASMPTIDETKFPNTPAGMFWTNMADHKEPYAYWVNFENGQLFAGGKGYPRMVRLVRYLQ